MRLFSVSFYLLVFSFIVTPPVAFGDYSGQVVDSYLGSAIEYATIYAPEINQSVNTDKDGRFEIKTGNKNTSLSISVHRLGYLTVTSKLQVDETTIIRLEPKSIGLEVVTLKSKFDTKEFTQPFVGDRLIEGLPDDVADVFANTPGFGVVRKGSYGADPVIRGFKREQLLVQVDGIGKIECACPNRMDPVTAQVQPEDLDKIQVVSGPYSLRYGSTIGGMINMMYDRPQPWKKDEGINLSASSRYESNGSGNINRLAIEKIGSVYGIKLTGGYKSFSDYQDGEGREIPSSYNVTEYTFLGSVMAVSNQHFDLLFRQSFADNLDYAGLPMDAAKDDATFGQLSWNYNIGNKYIHSVDISGYGSFVDHIMDNHQRKNFAMVDAVASTRTNTWGARVEFMVTGIPKGVLFAGVNADIISKRGTRERIISVNPCNGQIFDPPMVKNDAIWQDAESYTSGLFAEWQMKTGISSRLVSSLRMDMFSSDIGEPSTQFINEYGEDSQNSSEAFSATVSYEIQPLENSELRFSAGHSKRFPSITELYINHLSVGQDVYEYFGNPNLKPEDNSQFDLTFGTETRGIQSQIAGYYSFLTNAIYAEVDTTLPRLFIPCIDPPYTKRFTNIEDAAKWGFEWNTGIRLSNHLNMQTSFAYTWAQDITRNEPLPEIPPFEASWNLRYLLPIERNSWVMFQGRHVAEQKRSSDLYSESSSQAFSVYHLRMDIEVNRFSKFTFGIRNLFDKTYYEHLNRNFKNQLTMSQLYEPGRNYYMQLKVQL